MSVGNSVTDRVRDFDYAVIHHARTVLNTSSVEDWDLDALGEDDCLLRTAIIFNGWMAGESFLLASGIARNLEGPAGHAENPTRSD